MSKEANDLGIEKISGNIIVSKATGGKAWFKLPPQRWSFRTGSEREGLINAGALRYAALVGRRVHVRVTSRPYPVDAWAREVDSAFPNSLSGWSQLIRDEQRKLLGLTLAEKEVFVGIELKSHRLRPHAAAEEIREVESALSGGGVEARPATPAEVDYLMHRSVSLGFPAPAPSGLDVDWEPEDIPEFTSRSMWTSQPFGRSTRIVADVAGREHTRFVVVVSLGRMQDLAIPEAMEPWIMRSDRLGPIEWSITADVLETEKVRHDVHNVLNRVKATLKHFADHDEQPPAALTRQERLAVRVEDEVSGSDPLHTRVHAWVRAAVVGRTEEEAIDRAQSLINLYLPSLPFTRGGDQHSKAREFIPGQPQASTAHRRMMPVTTFAGAVPAATSVIGDRNGFHLGSTGGSSMRAACWNPWAAMEVRESSGTALISGTLGSGKSTLLGIVSFWATMAGIPTVLLDPPGLLSRLASHPDLRKVSVAIDLMDAEPGSLCPFAVIRDPDPEHHIADREDGMTDDQWNDASRLKYLRAVRTAEATRRMLCQDSLSAILPLSMIRDPKTQRALSDATHIVAASRRTSTREVLANLARGDDHAQYVGRTLTRLAELPQVALMFPDGETPDSVVRDDLILQVLTMRGNTMPSKDKPREQWSIAETLGPPLVTLAAHVATTRMYKDLHERTLLGMDEVWSIVGGSSAGKSLVYEAATNSRKFNTRIVFVSPDVDHVLAAGIGNLIDTVFGGLTTGTAAQESLLDALGIPLGVGYENVLGGLSPRERQSSSRTGFREFIWNDGDGGIEKIRIDIPDSVRAELDTTSDPMKSAEFPRSITSARRIA